MEAQSCDDELDHVTCVVAGIVVRADTEIADATQQFVGIHAGENLARRGSSVEQLGAHGDEAVEEIGVQSLEGGIVGRPVHTMLLPEFQTCQEGTLHFHYLLDAGLLRAARNLPEHLAQQAGTVATADPSTNANRAFVEAFVRPNGLGVSATDAFVDAVERLATITPQPLRDPMWAPAVRALLSPIADRTSGTFIESVGRQRRYREKAADAVSRNAALQRQRAIEKAQLAERRRLRAEAVLRERTERVAQHHAEKARLKAEKQREKEQRRGRRRREKHGNTLTAIVAKYYRRLVDSSSGS